MPDKGRIAHNSLPHRLNLLRRGLDLDPICPVCNRVNEDGVHLFLKCKNAKLGWRELQLNGLRDRLVQCQDAKAFVKEIIQLELQQKLKVIGLLW